MSLLAKRPNFSDNSIMIQTFSLTKSHSKMASAKLWSVCRDRNLLMPSKKSPVKRAESKLVLIRRIQCNEWSTTLPSAVVTSCAWLAHCCPKWVLVLIYGHIHSTQWNGHCCGNMAVLDMRSMFHDICTRVCELLWYHHIRAILVNNFTLIKVIFNCLLNLL